MQTKTCSKCEEPKATSEFYRTKATKDGFTSACKSCTYIPVDKKTPVQKRREYVAANKQSMICKKCDRLRPQALFLWSGRCPQGTTATCAECIEKQSLLRQGKLTKDKKNKIKFKYWRMEKLALGLCTHCGNRPLITKTFCKSCYISINKGRISTLRLRELQGLCKTCGGEKPPEMIRCKACSSRLTSSKKSQEHRLRTQVFALLGDKCECCLEARESFLTLDHREGLKGWSREGNRPGLFRKIIAGERTDMRILCYNCNFGRNRNNGICPHKDDDTQVGN